MSVNGLRPYPAYRDSGLDWLGEVPEHWEVRRLGATTERIVAGTWGSDPTGRDDIVCVRVADFDRPRLGVDLRKPTLRSVPVGERRGRLLEAGDLLLEKSGGGDLQPVGAVFHFAHDQEAVASNFIGRMRVRRQNSARYVLYLNSVLYAIRLTVRSIKQTTGIQNLDVGAYLSESIPLPPLPEQTAIARFLDDADRRIRRYIRAKERLIELLEERKRALIHEAVTGRIDVRTGQPYPAYKDSGVEWLGNVPEHWEVSRLGRLVSLAVGFPFKSEGFTQSRADIRLLRGVNIAPGGLRWNEVVRWRVGDVDEFVDYQMDAGDIVLGMDRPVVGGGVRVAMIGPSDVPSLLLQRVARIRPSKGLLERDFALALLHSGSFADYLAPIFTGISVPHLSPKQIREFRFALPSVVEQQAIIGYLKPRISTVRSAMACILKQVQSLREYRTRLIADVVTGKVDVREAAADLPEADPLADGDGGGTIHTESNVQASEYDMAKEAGA